MTETNKEEVKRCLKFGGECREECSLYPCKERVSYEQGRQEREEEIIKILESNWIRGTVARRIIDEIIDEIKES